jgi:hypothetical protein
MTEISGKANVTINKNGILISKDSKEGTDLIDEALKYNGQLPVKMTPDAPTTPRATVPTAPVDSNKTRNANSGATPSAAATPAPTPAVIKPQ